MLILRKKQSYYKETYFVNWEASADKSNCPGSDIAAFSSFEDAELLIDLHRIHTAVGGLAFGTQTSLPLLDQEWPQEKDM